MSDLAFFLLGSPRIERNGKATEIRRRKAMALAVYLAVTGRSHSANFQGPCKRLPTGNTRCHCSRKAGSG